MIDSNAAFRAVGLLLAAATFLASVTGLANPQPGLEPPPEGLDRSTPQRTMRFFFSATESGNFDHAAYALDLRGYAPPHQKTQGPILTRELRYVLDRKLWVDLGLLSDDPLGQPDDGLLTEHVADLPLQESHVPLRLTRVPLADGSAVWVLSRETVRAIPALYDEYGPGWLGDHLPDWAHRQSFAYLSMWQWIGLLGGTLFGLLLAFVATGLGLRVAARLAVRTRTQWDDLLVQRLRGPLRSFLTVTAVEIFVATLKLPLRVEPVIQQVLVCWLIASVVWMAMRIISAVADAMTLQLVANHADQVVVQGTRTRVAVVRRIINAVVLIIGAALALTQFDVVRRVGVSVLASAGVAGVVFGLAAQKVLGNLLAGIQLSIAQPVRIGDRVFIENQFGFVEELGLTFAVVKTWDDRRIVLPITQLIEKPFENWTRTSDTLTGVILLHADYRLPIGKVRDEFLRLVRADPAWNGTTADLVLIDATERTLTLRGTASASATDVWDLRCRIREQLVEYLQQLDDGRYLPLTRVEIPRGVAA